MTPMRKAFVKCMTEIYEKEKEERRKYLAIAIPYAMWALSECKEKPFKFGAVEIETRDGKTIAKKGKLSLEIDEAIDLANFNPFKCEINKLI